MDLGLTDKVLLVTGGASGIGEAVVKLAAAEGALPVIADRNRAAGEHLVASLQAAGRRAHFIEVELGTSDSCRQVVEETLAACGRLDGLVNNAGVNDGVGLAVGSPEAFLASLGKNLHHAYFLAHYALDALKATQGCIVNVASKTALTGQGGTSGYAAAKGALLGLTREWAAELASFGIRVNAVVPAEVQTPLYDSWLATFEAPEVKRAEITRRIPFGQRMTTAEEVASMVVYLASRQASHVTGQFLFVDGGYVHLDRALAGLRG